MENQLRISDLVLENGVAVEKNVRYIKQSDIKKCPNYICAPEHYNPNGTCKCTDKSETIMKEWGYKWSEKKGRWV